MGGFQNSGERLAHVWERFCNDLAEASATLMRPCAPADMLGQAEGVRYLSRLTRAALDSFVESADLDFPRLYQLSYETIKIGGDNPDNIYWNATIAGDRDYCLYGTRGSVPYLSFGKKANRFSIDGGMVSTGELQDAGMHFQSDGSFEIIIRQQRQGRNWLPLTNDTSLLLVRQTFLDKAVETPAVIHIERIAGPDRARPLTAATLQCQLRRAADFVRVTSRNFAEWTEMFMSCPNELLPWDQAMFQKVGGDPNIHYLHGYWHLEPDEAWVIETEVPSCRFWNFVLQNWWMESGDYPHLPNAWTNKRKARLDPSEKLTIVVAPSDPGVGNWIDTTGHQSGTALLRWISAEAQPTPTCRVVKRKDFIHFLA
jgi:hypothetical protein